MCVLKLQLCMLYSCIMCVAKLHHVCFKVLRKLLITHIITEKNILSSHAGVILTNLGCFFIAALLLIVKPKVISIPSGIFLWCSRFGL